MGLELVHAGLEPIRVGLGPMLADLEPVYADSFPTVAKLDHRNIASKLKLPVCDALKQQVNAGLTE